MADYSCTQLDEKRQVQKPGNGVVEYSCNKMSKVTHSQQEPADIIKHFSHLHPLQLHNIRPQETLSVCTCCGCKLEGSGLVYACTFCGHFLHISCSKLPQRITHLFDRHSCVLSLLPAPVSPQGVCRCDACGMQCIGLTYQNRTCNIDLHPLCTTRPLTMTHQSHPHQLNLAFSAPYQNNCFSCDVCHMPGSNQWLYRCNYCDFDVHLACTAAKTQPKPQTHRVQQYQAAPRNQTVQNRAAPNVVNGLVGQVIQGVVQGLLGDLLG